jgi:predicted O-methyltransferase YrrM
MQQIKWTRGVAKSERWAFDDIPFQIDGVDYICTLEHRSKRPQTLCIKKPPALVEATANLLADFQNANIVEVGISQGGSTALTAQLARPRKLVALELDPEPVTQLQDLIDRTGVSDNVRPYYGVDQADRARLHQILDDEFGAEPLDLVMDDASHLLEPTRTSFEVLFPRLRPGGLFVLEDWNWQHLRAKGLQRVIEEPGSPSQKEFERLLREALADTSSPEYAAFIRWQDAQATNEHAMTPGVAATDLLTFLVIELLLARAWSGDAISRIDVLDLWVVVHRGPAELDPNTFRTADIARDHFDVIGRLSR